MVQTILSVTVNITTLMEVLTNTDGHQIIMKSQLIIKSQNV